jgi:LysM repeat protein
MQRKIALFFILMLLLSAWSSSTYNSANLLNNPGLEEPYSTTPLRKVAGGWNAWIGAGSADFYPEMYGSVYSGARSQAIMSSHPFPNQPQPSDMGIYQTIGGIPVGSRVQASAAVSMYLAGNKTDDEFKGTEARIVIGIDPNGGTNPYDGDVVWSGAAHARSGSREGGNVWRVPYLLVSAQATTTASSVTVFIRAIQQWPVEEQRYFLDNANLQITEQGSGSTGQENPAGGTTDTTTTNPTAVPAAPVVNYTASVQGPREDGSIVHIIQSGNTLYAIASAYGVSADEITALNPEITNWSMIYPGNEIIIRPATTPPTTTPPATKVEIEEAIELLALAGMENNADWTPVVQDFGGVDMVLVPAGCFMMGSNDGNYDEQPVNEQCFDEPFWIERYEVTNEEYGSTGCEDWSSELDQPRNCISWSAASDYCESLSGRLPTEGEWEYAAGGPDNLIYPWGNEFVAENVIYKDSPEYGDTKAAPIGHHEDGISWVGAYDLSGNVWEWTSTVYQQYPYDAEDGRENSSNINVLRVLRGGSFDYDEFNQRTATRLGDIPDNGSGNYGFRCARDYDFSESEPTEPTPESTEQTQESTEPTPEPTATTTQVPDIDLEACTYTVQRGDNSYRIAANFGITYQALVDANPQVGNFRQIHSGLVLNIPGENCGGN